MQIPIRVGIPIKGMNTVLQPREMKAEFSPLIQDFWFYDGIFLRKRPAVRIYDANLINNVGFRTFFEYSYRNTYELFFQGADGFI